MWRFFYGWHKARGVLYMICKSYEEAGELIDDALVNAFTKLQEVAVKKSIEATNRAKKRYSAYEKNVIKEEFNKAVSQFYRDYSPKEYKRQADMGSETGGLYALLEMELDENGRPIYGDDHEALINPDNLHGDRKGGSLYNKVFKLGFHGGAEGIDGSLVYRWGRHPDPGVPYWRRPGILISKSGKRTGRIFKYARWGRQAAQSVPSPYDLFDINMAERESTDLRDELYRLLREEAAKASEEIQTKEIPKLIKSYFK